MFNVSEYNWSLKKILSLSKVRKTFTERKPKSKLFSFLYDTENENFFYE